MRPTYLDMEHADRLFIGGAWVEPATDRAFEIIHPADETAIARVAEAREQDMDRAIASARAAFDDGPWPGLHPSERAAALRRLADALERRHGEIGVAQTAQIGIPIAMTARAAQGLPEEARRTAALSDRFAFVEERPAMGGRNIVVREPVGVVAAIVPWNYPAHLGLLKLCPALLAGCTVVMKSSPEAPLDLHLLALAVEEADLPPGVVSILPGDRDIGDRLIRDPRIDKVSFTGSTAVGRHIGAVCMDRLARVSLELGGKSAAIVLDDLPVEQIVPGLVAMSTLLNGQACMALTRVLVSRGRQAAVAEALGAAYAALTVGDPFDPATRVGPLASARQRERVEGHIADGIAQGARLVTGGGRPAGLERGFFVQPTVFDSVAPEMRIAREEIFGPVVSVIAYDDIDDAVRIANDTPFGLSGAVFTADPERSLAIARRLRTGTVAQNAMGPQPGQPFGGFKQSGIGREGSVEALELFTEVKSVYMASALQPAV